MRLYYFRVTLSRLAARSRYAAPSCPARGPQQLCGSGPTLASSGQAQPGHMPSSAPSESAAPVPTLARTFARGATALALRLFVDDVKSVPTCQDLMDEFLEAYKRDFDIT